jgi:hypothetical protein
MSNTPERLIKSFEKYDEQTLTDHLSFLARDIEDAMLQCGGVPGIDYTFMDIFKLASQLATTTLGSGGSDDCCDHEH